MRMEVEEMEAEVVEETEAEVVEETAGPKTVTVDMPAGTAVPGSHCREPAFPAPRHA